MDFYTLTVSDVTRETENTVTLSFTLPDDLTPYFQYQAGQFLTVKLSVDGETLQRAYSLNSSPALEEPLQITVRAIQDGRVSNWINSHINIGDQLQVAPPSGRFSPDIQRENHRSYYLFAAGSGITPILSIAKTVLAVEPWSQVYLLYGSRDENNIILRNQVEQLATQHPARMKLTQTLSQPQSKRWSALWRDVEDWQGETGRVDTERVQAFIQQHPPQIQECHYLICGPEAMIQSTRTALQALDVDPQHILHEQFSSAPNTNNEAHGCISELEIRFAGKRSNQMTADDENLLQTLLRHDHPVTYSCQSGVCGNCRATLRKGEVTMQNPAALTEQEIEQGEILLCQAYAQSEQLAIELPDS